MPYRLQYIPSKRCYSVRRKKKRKNQKKTRIFSKCTTKEKAQKQIRLLTAVKYNKKFRNKMRETRRRGHSKS
jgi:hypothetical protein